MDKFVAWDSSHRVSSGKNSVFLRLAEGANRVRFFGRPVSYTKAPFNPGDRPKPSLLSHVLCNGEVKVLDIPRSVADALREYADGDSSRVNGPTAPEFNISARGEGLKRRYMVMPGQHAPLPAGLDVAKLDAELLALSQRLQERNAEQGRVA